jgi:tRNA(Ile)-lysidine synthase
MPLLAAEGGDARNLARLASRLARANAAIEILVDGAERYLALRDRVAASPSEIGAKTFEAKTFETKTFEAKAPGAAIFEAKAFAAMPEEIRLRLLLRAIDRFGHEGPAELGKVEAMLSVLGRAMTEPNSRRRPRLKQTLAGALVSLIDDRITVAPAPPRRRRSD